MVARRRARCGGSGRSRPSTTATPWASTRRCWRGCGRCSPRPSRPRSKPRPRRWWPRPRADGPRTPSTRPRRRRPTSRASPGGCSSPTRTSGPSSSLLAEVARASSCRALLSTNFGFAAVFGHIRRPRRRRAALRRSCSRRPTAWCWPDRRARGPRPRRSPPTGGRGWSPSASGWACGSGRRRRRPSTTPPATHGPSLTAGAAPGRRRSKPSCGRRRPRCGRCAPRCRRRRSGGPAPPPAAGPA